MPFEEVGVRAVVKDARGYQRDLDRMERRTKGFGSTFGGLAKQALAVGAGFVAAQVGMQGVRTIMSKSIGAAVAYEAQMAEIRALTGATEKDTDLLTVAIKGMTRNMPKSPEELGSAAYFILSSGIEDAAEAADVLNVAARASTIGLGETESVANALTTVLNAYGKSAGEAGAVTDVMIEAVKQGKAEASEFAGVLGRVVPLAAQMGISFEEVAANLATFTRLGVSADEAATGLRQVMASLLKPTEDQEEAMQELGFTAEGLRKQIREEGLLRTLDAMTKATGGNEAAVSRLFPNIRALTSVLGTAGVQMDAYTDILAATENATGNLEEGFAIVADTAKFKMGVAMNELNLMLMELGEEILPALVPAMRAVVFAAQTLGEALQPLVLTIGLISSAFDNLPSKEELVTQRLQEMAANAEITKEELIELAEGVGLTALEARKLADDTSFPTQMEVWRQRAIAFGMAGEEFDRRWKEAGAGFGRTAGEIQTETDRMIQIGKDLAAEMEANVGPAVTGVLFDIEEAADNTKSALLGMFREPTQEEAAAEKVLADYKFELGKLEAASEDAATVEGSRAAQLKNDLIPTTQKALDLIRLEKDAVVADAQAKLLAAPSLDAWKESISRGAQQMERLNSALATTTDFRGFNITVQQAELFMGAQHGFHGMVTGPHGFFIEPGRTERVDITPQAQVMRDRVLAPSVVNNSPSVEVNLEQHFDGRTDPVVVKEAAQEGVKVGLRQYMRLRGAVL